MRIEGCIMKNLIFLFFFSSLASASVVIEHDADACLTTETMDVVVFVSGERFYFNPRCALSFGDRIVTSRGVKCTVESGMCSKFSPSQRFEVDCSDDYRDAVNIKCP